MIIEDGAEALETNVDPVVETPAAETPEPTEAQVLEAKEAASVAAFDKGVEATPADGEVAPIPKDAADVAAAATEAAAKVAVEAALTPEAKAKAEDEAELASMGLRTQKATERFKAMKSTIREDEPFMSVLKERKIDNPQLLKDALDTMDRTIQWEQTLHESTATPEQFNMALTVIRAMNGDDPKLLRVCYDELQKQVQAVGQKIGITGAADALESYAAHPDIQAALADGSITPEVAQELAQRRAAELLRDQGQLRSRNAEQQTRQQQEHQQREESAARAGIDELSNKLKANDPEFAAKLAILTPVLPSMIKGVPPHLWVAKIAEAYALVRVPAPTPQRVRPGHMAMRPAAQAQGMQPARTRDNAFEMGVAEMTHER